MRIDAKGTIGRYPALLVRSTLRHLRSRLRWGLAELEAAAGLTPGRGRALVKALRSEGLISAAGRGAWEVTQAGRTLSAATAAKRITRATAEKTLQQFLGRVERVNNDPYFLGKVTRVVLFGSMLKPEVERLSDVDAAVEVASKEADFDLARAKNYERVEELAAQGHRFRKLPNASSLPARGSSRILEGALSRHRFGGLRHGEDVRAEGSAPRAIWWCGINFISPEIGNTATTGAEKAPARLPFLVRRGGSADASAFPDTKRNLPEPDLTGKGISTNWVGVDAVGAFKDTLSEYGVKAPDSSQPQVR